MRGCVLFSILTACSDPSPGPEWETHDLVKTSTYCLSREVWQDGSWWITFTVQSDAGTELDWERALFSRSEGLVLTRFQVGPDVVQEDGSPPKAFGSIRDRPWGPGATAGHFVFFVLFVVNPKR